MAACPNCKGSFSDAVFCPRDGARLVEELATGDVLDERYKLLRQVGSGAMGVVYEAEHVHIHRRVAVKVLREGLAKDAQAVQRLQQEAQLTSDLGHANIVQCRDFGYARDGRVYLVMEWLDGETLEALLERDGVDVAAAVEIAIQTCAGLAQAHASHVVHRDLKPANLFLCRERDGKLRVKILDFGIAKLAEQQASLTATGMVIGTPNYISPEQAIGDAVDARADLYALGVILYEMVAGVVPFRGDSALAVLHQHSIRMPVAPSETAPERAIPPALEQIVLRCLAKRPDDRFTSADELRLALAQVRDTLGHDSAPVSMQPMVEPAPSRPIQSRRTLDDDEPIVRPRRRAPWIVAGITVASIAALVVMIAGRGSHETAIRLDASAGIAVVTNDARPTRVALDATIFEDAVIAVDAHDAEQPSITVTGIGAQATVELAIPEAPIVGRPFQIAGTLTKLPPVLAEAMAAGELHVKLKLQYFRQDDVNLFDQITHADRGGHFTFTVTLKHAAKHHAEVELSTDHGTVDRMKLQLYESLIR